MKLNFMLPIVKECKIFEDFYSFACIIGQDCLHLQMKSEKSSDLKQM